MQLSAPGARSPLRGGWVAASPSGSPEVFLANAVIQELRLLMRTGWVARALDLFLTPPRILLISHSQPAFYTLWKLQASRNCPVVF